jgi:hypothetical protein
MKIKERAKKYFTEKPKGDFWFWAFITLIVFRYIGIYSLMFLVPFQIGLLAPETEINYSNISLNLANSFTKPLEIFGNAGQSIGSNHPIISKILFYALANFIYVWYLAILTLIINLIRYGIYGLFFKKKIKNRKKLKNEV